MNYSILSQEIQDFIVANENQDTFEISIKKSPFLDVKSIEIAQQIKGRQIAKIKFPFLLKIKDFYYPPHLNLEQASSEFTANYKSKLVIGDSFLDLTGGMGIDTFFMGNNSKSITYVEKNTDLFEISTYNLKLLLPECSIEFINKTAELFLQTNCKKYDTIYIDPSRRVNGNRRFLLEDLEPNLMKIQDNLVEISDRIIIKLSSLFDIQECIKKIKNVAEIHIVSFKNEVKEMLVIVNKNSTEKIGIKAVELFTHFEFNFTIEDEKNAQQAHYSSPEKYVYIPSNALLKAGCFNLIAEKFKLNKLHPNTHIYTSNYVNKDFFGRIFERVEVIEKPNSLFKIQANVISKNYPQNVKDLKKKYKIKDGGELYVIFAKSIDENCIIKAIQITA